MSSPSAISRNYSPYRTQLPEHQLQIKKDITTAPKSSIRHSSHISLYLLHRKRRDTFLQPEQPISSKHTHTSYLANSEPQPENNINIPPVL